MADVESRLLKIFESVFPAVPQQQLRNVDQHNTAAWDSIATVTLISLIEEEFNISFDLDRMETLTSFAAVRDSVEKSRQEL